MAPIRNDSYLHRNRPSRPHIAVRGSGRNAAKPPLAKGGKIPAGCYRSTVLGIKAVNTAAGDEAVEVTYELTNEAGSQLKMREIIPVDSWFFERFCDAMIAAGLREDDDLTAAVGVSEDIELEYPDPKGFGRFKTRIPAASNVECRNEDTPALSVDDEFDEDDVEDFLEEDD